MDSIELPDDPRSVPAARDFVRAALSRGGLDSPEAVLVASELAANVVRHARTPFVVSVEVHDHQILIEVEDGAGALTVASNLATDSGGLGLRVVEALATGWGVVQRGDGKAVWVRLPRSPGVSTPEPVET